MSQTDTPEFKRWFGQSQIVENGEPLMVYHWTQAESDFSEFNAPSHFARRPMRKTPLVERARLKPCFLKMDNPKETRGSVYAVTEDQVAEAKRQGHDGLIQRSRGRVYYVVFSPRQVKSATGNRGTFNPDDPDERS